MTPATRALMGGARWLALAAYVALMALLAAWYGWLHPPRVVPPAAAVALALVPLLTALPGLLRGRPYTHAWASLLILAYLAHGIMESLAAPAQAGLARLEVVLASLFFAAALLYARLRGRQERRARERERVTVRPRPGGP